MRVEAKGLSITLHYRGAPEIAAEVADLGARLAERGGLEVRPAKMSVELHPPVATDKGTVVDRVASGTAAAMYLGDDRGDLPAFDGLDRVAVTGTHTLRGAVRSEEAPDELLRRADLVLDGPTAVLGLLRSLVG
jgi:trehalose 6-phosphate phosphatase